MSEESFEYEHSGERKEISHGLALSSRNHCRDWGEARLLRAHTALAEDSGLGPSTGIVALLLQFQGIQGVLYAHGAHTYMSSGIHTHIY